MAPKAIMAITQQTINGKIFDLIADDFLDAFTLTLAPHLGQKVFLSLIFAPHILQYIKYTILCLENIVFMQFQKQYMHPFRDIIT